MDTREITLHGHHVSYRTAGDGPEVVVLIHGITGSADTWAEAIPALAEEFTVVAPDLLGHGHSAKPRGDYSLGAYASGVRDLVAALGYDHATVVGHSLGGGVAMQLAYQFPERCDRLAVVSPGGPRRDRHPPPCAGVRDLVAALGYDHATVVGHSLGGGVAMQLAYQFPERCDRLVLVSSGGLGREVHPLLRAAALPGAEFVLPLVCATRLRDAGNAVWGALGQLRLSAGP